MQVLIKPVSSKCNMRCSYCFYHEISQNRYVTDYGFTTIETAKGIIDQASQTSDRVVYAFQGGEPTLIGIEFYQAFVDYAIEKTKEADFLIQTNGLVINKKWVDFFKKYDFLVGISIDGNKYLHNMNRFDTNNKSTYHKTIKAYQSMDKAGVRVNVLTVVTDALAKKIISVYRHYQKMNFKYLQFIPVIDSNPKCQLSVENYGSFLKTLFDLWYKDLFTERALSIRFFDNLLSMYMGYEPESCVMKGQCSLQFVIESDGSVFPCDFYAYDEYLGGNIKTESFESIKRSSASEKFLSDKDTPEKCLACGYFSLCRNGCKKSRENGILKYCQAYKDFYSYIEERMIRLSQSNVIR